jgi:hypothetical protein
MLAMTHLGGSYAGCIRSECLSYFTNISTKGKVRYGKLPFAISVIESPKNYVPIGMVYSVTSTDAGLAVWRLTVQDVELRGRFVVIDGEFVELSEAAL